MRLIGWPLGLSWYWTARSASRTSIWSLVTSSRYTPQSGDCASAVRVPQASSNTTTASRGRCSMVIVPFPGRTFPAPYRTHPLSDQPTPSTSTIRETCPAGPRHDGLQRFRSGQEASRTPRVLGETGFPMTEGWKSARDRKPNQAGYPDIPGRSMTPSRWIAFPWYRRTKVAFTRRDRNRYADQMADVTITRTSVPYSFSVTEIAGTRLDIIRSAPCRTADAT